MSSTTYGLQPEKLWSIFSKICSIPHCSKKEALLSDYIKGLACDTGLTVQNDTAGNICIYVPASCGYENAPSIAIQCHLDMVCEKNDSATFDFDKDPVKLIRNGDFIKADETTLGADNGIGVAAALAICLSKDIIHGPLEILLTVDEETGLTGAFSLSPGLLTSKTLINLDHEDIKTVCIGCAGGGCVEISLPLTIKKQTGNRIFLEISVEGLQGGHSGLNIHENRANALKILALTLWNLADLDPCLLNLNGGNKINAIPREARACISIDKEFASLAQDRVKNSLTSAQIQYPRDKNLYIRTTVKTPPENCCCFDSFKKTIGLILALPCGVTAMSREIRGLVETSCNIGSVQTDNNMLVVKCMPRSSCPEGIKAITEQLKSIGYLAEARVEIEEPYPAWKPGTDSKILKTVRGVFRDVTGIFPETDVTHAGLECGIIGSKYKGLDMIAIGPTIVDAHSPDEAVHIGSVETFWTVLIKTLEKLASLSRTDSCGAN